MESHRYLPDANRLSVLSAMILLAYAVTQFIQLPARELGIQAPGVYLFFQLNLQTIISVLVAALAAVGMDWLLSDHPALRGVDGPRWRATLQHWILPALTAWALGVPLANQANTPGWWAVFALGAALLILVFLAEYVVVDISDIRHPLATAALTGLSFALYLILTIAARSANLRLYLLLPALVMAAGLVSLRTVYLRLSGRWKVAWALGISLIIGQLAIGLHYLPISPVRYGLFLLGPLYALTSLAGAVEEERSWQRGLVEPVAMLILLWGLGLILR